VNTPCEREKARRRPVLRHIDAEYQAGRISERARQLAKWYVRKQCPIGGSWFETTQAEQARDFGVARRTLIELIKQLEARNIIWIERRGTANRTYITAYQAPPTDHEPGETAPSEVQELGADELRAYADAATAVGDWGRAAMFYFQLGQLLAHKANDIQPTPISPATAEAGAFFGDGKGDPEITKKVQSAAPSTFNLNSDPPKGGIASPVYDAGGGGKHISGETNEQPRNEHEEPPIVQRLRAGNVQHEATLKECSAAPGRAAEVFRAWHAKGGGPGLFYTMWHHGVWGGWQKCGKHVDTSPVSPALDDEDAWRDKYTGGPLAPYIIGGRNDPPPHGEEVPLDQVDETPKPERYRRDAEHALIDGWVPPALRPMPAPPDTHGDDDPEVRKYLRYGDLPQWDEGGTP